jgi:large subunit ribosomal protein L20
MHGLIESGVAVNRKALSNMAIEDPIAFKAIVMKSKEVLAAAAPAAGVGAK